MYFKYNKIFLFIVQKNYNIEHVILKTYYSIIKNQYNLYFKPYFILYEYLGIITTLYYL